MNREALFCDGTQDYVIPAEPKENEKIKIRFRTAHNDVEEVHILTGNSSYPMWKIVSEGEFDFYEIEWQLSDVPFSYLFEVKSGDQICYFSRCGVSDQREDFLCVYDRSGIFYSRVGKRRGYVSDFCGSVL